MNDNPASSPSPMANVPGGTEPRTESDLPDRTVGVYEQPERKKGLSPLVLGLIALLIVVVLAMFLLPSLF